MSADAADLAHGLDHRTHALYRHILAADEHEHVAADRAVDRAGHRRIHGEAAAFRERLPERAHERGAAGGEVDPGLARAVGGENRPFSPRATCSTSFGPKTIVTTTSTAERTAAGCGAPCRAGLVDQRPGGLLADIVDDQREAPSPDVAGGMSRPWCRAR